MTTKPGLLLISLLLPGALSMPAYAGTTAAQPNRQQATVDYDSKTAAVTFAGNKTDRAALIKASTDAGYPGSLGTPASR